MSHRAFIWAAALCCAASLSAQSHAQPPAVKKDSPPARGPYRVKASAESRQVDAVAQAQRDTAISIITSLVDASERYQDPILQSRTQARAADALWNTDQERARDLFRRAWETAERVDKDGERIAEEARRRFMTSRNGEIVMIPPVPNLRAEVLRLAAQRDRALGEDLIARLDDAEGQETVDSNLKNAAPSFFDPTEPKLAIARRLELAVQLLDAGDVERAKAFAIPALKYVTSQGIIFLSALRSKDAGAADELYAKLLASTARDPSADATSVSLLSSYVFTPNLLVTATRRGMVSNQLRGTAETHDLRPELRARFFAVAATVLLRPLPAPDQDHTSAGRAGTYFTIVRLMSLFARHAPGYVPALNARLTLLSPDAPETFRNGEESMLRLGLASDRPDGDGLSEILDQIDGAASSADRDAIYVRAIRAAAAKGESRIQEFAEKIEDANLRERARIFADFAAARNAVAKKDVDGGLRIIHEGSLSPLHRVWTLVQVARLLEKSESVRSLQLLNEAATEAKQISLGTPERVYAFVCIASSLFEADRLLSWDLAAEAVKAANAAENFCVDDCKLPARLRAKNITVILNPEEPSFNMVNLFALLASDDLQLARSTANKLTGEAPRAAVSLAVARSVLDRQKRSTASLRK